MYEKINYFMDIHEAYLEENYDEFDNEVGESRASHMVGYYIYNGIIPTLGGTRGGKFGKIDPKYIKDKKIDLKALEKDRPAKFNQGNALKVLLKNKMLPGGKAKQMDGSPSSLKSTIKKARKRLVAKKLDIDQSLKATKDFA